MLTYNIKIKSDGTLSRSGVQKLMVTRKSATGLGLTAGVREDNIPFRRDHSGLVKFEDGTQDDYIKVRERIRTFVKAIPPGLELRCR